MINEYENLKNFLAGYFHQDWLYDDESAIAVVERYLSEWPRDEVLVVIEEIGQLLEEVKNEADLRAAVLKLGSYYEVGADGLTYRDWLKSVSERLAAG
ncbi:contact-dependent growth inhibition system immunity protein [Methyloversatilis sp. XJ19-49]|uniref:contact-dependent growth inhibition system immunity protein n=1 Tax=Methyloversatilis sp. XJ19-49 TaxID=2963429 RepID=UPI00211BF165|nr:contact-dependent growth inhibition system immunity protein [Methyloversatilis sp. XJ19-49]MCQ9379746.1 contact-dependent growth inhibition system immunity protein [Methyloversatilis sp. XJ19-49]